LLLVIGEHLVVHLIVLNVLGRIVVVLVDDGLRRLWRLRKMMLLQLLRRNLESWMVGWIRTRAVHLWWAAILMRQRKLLLLLLL